MATKWCSNCVYPSSSAAPLTFDENGVCSGCRVSAQIETLNWEERLDKLREIVEPYRSTSNYDIVVPVSGGKDSYFSTHVCIKELGLKPLLVNYHGYNYLPEAEYNLFRMREVFDCDQVMVRPSVDVLIRLNRLCFRLQGDMNLHAHMGIWSTPVQLAVRYKVPLMMWGEHGYMDLGGMYSYKDFVEFTKKTRIEHGQHGYEWTDLTDEGLERLGRPELKEGLTAKDLVPYMYPTDDEIDEVGVRGLYTSNFVVWDANKHYQIVKDEYDWRPAQQPYERTYRMFSNLDDIHENGIHDWLKFVKLGYGRGSDHASKDIRHGHITREQGVERVRKYDHVKPTWDLERWLEYVGMSIEEFDYTCDSMRDRRVWRVENGEWVKDNIWGGSSSYGPVHTDDTFEPSKRGSFRDGGSGRPVNTTGVAPAEEKIARIYDD